MTIPERMGELEKKMSKLWDANEALTKRVDAIEQDDGAEAFDRTEEASASPSIFGTPQRLIPEGAVEFVSDGFRALRFWDEFGSFEARVVSSDGADLRFNDDEWHDDPYWSAGRIDLKFRDTGTRSRPLYPWLRYWLSHFSEPMPGAVEDNNSTGKGVPTNEGPIDCRWFDGVAQWRPTNPGNDSWEEYFFGVAGYEEADAWFEANKPDPAPKCTRCGDTGKVDVESMSRNGWSEPCPDCADEPNPSPSNAPLTDEGDETERARRDAETEKPREEVAELRAKNDIRFSLTRTAAVNTKLRAQIADLEAQLSDHKQGQAALDLLDSELGPARFEGDEEMVRWFVSQYRDLEAQLKAAKERAPDESAAVTEATATIEKLRGRIDRMRKEMCDSSGKWLVPKDDLDAALAQAATARERFEGLRERLADIKNECNIRDSHLLVAALEHFPPLPEPGEGERVVWRDAPRDNKAPERGYYWVQRDDPEPDLHFYSEGQDFGMLVYRIAGPLVIPEPTDPEITESEP